MSNPIIFDSDEELYFSWYLDELKAAGYVLDYNRPATVELAPNAAVAYRPARSTVTGKKVILREQVYTPDFEVTWAEKARNVLFTDMVRLADAGPLTPLPTAYSSPFMARDGVSLLEVKGGYTDPNEARIYSILAKWLFAATGRYAQRVKVSNQVGSIFALTFVPVKFLLTDKTKKPRKIHFNVRLMKDFLAGV